MVRRSGCARSRRHGANVTRQLSFAAHISSRLVMQLADPSGYTSFGFRPIDLPRFVAGRALDPVDRVELQIAEAPAALADAIAALVDTPAGVRPPLALEERSA